MGPISPRLPHAGRAASVQDHWPHQRSAAVADGGRASNAAGDARQWLALPGDSRGGVDRGDSHFLTWQKLRGLVFFLVDRFSMIDVGSGVFLPTRTWS